MKSVLRKVKPIVKKTIFTEKYKKRTRQDENVVVYERNSQDPLGIESEWMQGLENIFQWSKPKVVAIISPENAQLSFCFEAKNKACSMVLIP
jgi:hypothetical protein